MIKDYQLFKEKILKDISNNNLDIGATYFILQNILIEIEALYYAQINKELLEMPSHEEQKQEEGEE